MMTHTLTKFILFKLIHRKTNKHSLKHKVFLNAFVFKFLNTFRSQQIFSSSDDTVDLVLNVHTVY